MRSLLCILVVSVATIANGQESAESKPGKAHQVLAKHVGTWECDVKMFFQGPNAPPSEFKGVEVNRLVSGDMYLQSSFNCPMGDRGDFEGHSLMGYDHRIKKYIGMSVNSFTTVPTQLKGNYNKDANTFTVYSTSVDGSGKELKSKHITTWLDESTKKLEVFLLVDAGGKQTNVKLMEIMSLKRK